MRGLVAIATMAVLTACNGQSDRAGESRGSVSADGSSSEFALTDFEEVSLRGPDNVEVIIGDEFSVRAEGDAKAIAELEIDVRRGRLRIGRASDSYFGSNSHSGQATIYVTMPAIRGASVAGSGDMTIASAESDEFEASVAGSGNLSIATLRSTNAEFDIAGSGDIRAAGTANEIEVSIAGSGSVEIGDLQARKLEARIAGSGDVTAYATEEAEASIMGSGDVVVTGGARCSSNAMGSGELRCS